MVDRNERLVGGVGECFGVAEADEQSSGEPRALRYGDGVDGFVSLTCVLKSFANDRNDGAKMLARSEFGDHASERLVRGDLRVNDVGDEFFARTNDSGGGFVARGLDAEDVGV